MDEAVPATGLHPRCVLPGSLLSQSRSARVSLLDITSHDTPLRFQKWPKNRAFGGAVSNGVYLGQPRVSTSDQELHGQPLTRPVLGLRAFVQRKVVARSAMQQGSGAGIMAAINRAATPPRKHQPKEPSSYKYPRAGIGDGRT